MMLWEGTNSLLSASLHLLLLAPETAICAAASKATRNTVLIVRMLYVT